MLRWQHKSVLKRHKLWAKLIVCSLSMHLIFLLLLFIGYREKINLVFSMSAQSLPNKGAPVTLVSIRPASRTLTRRPVAKKQATRSVQRRTPVTKVAQAQKKIIQKPAPKKVAPKSTPKPVTKKIVQVKKTIAPVQHTQNKSAAKSQSSMPQTIQFDSNQKVDDTMMQQFMVLQRELAKHWKPPVGINQDCACQVTAHINWQGKIEEVAIEHQSGVLMFDVAARTAMLAMNLPKWTWGKSLTITFKP